MSEAFKVEEKELTPEMVLETGRKLRKIWLENLTEEELASLSPEKRQSLVATLPPEDRLAGLTPEDMPKLMEQIEHFLKQQANRK